MKRAILVDRLRRVFGAGPSSGRRCLCPHSVDLHDDRVGCRHVAEGVPCLCPAGPQMVADERRGDKR